MREGAVDQEWPLMHLPSSLSLSRMWIGQSATKGIGLVGYEKLFIQKPSQEISRVARHT